VKIERLLDVVLKWTNKGHQFNKIAQSLLKSKYVCIYCTGQYDLEGYNKPIYFLDSIDFFVSADTILHNTGIIGKDVLSPKALYSKFSPDETLVIIASYEKDVIAHYLLTYGYNFYTLDNFYKLYLPVYYLYRLGKLYIPELTITVTDACSLSCENCSFGGYVNLADSSLDIQCKSIDTLFSNVDYVERLAIVGGEPFIYNRFVEVILHLLKYRSKIDKIRIVSNLYADIDSSFLVLLRNNNISIEYSNYSSEIKSERITRKIESNLSMIKNLGLILTEIRHETWVDFGIKKRTVNRSISDLTDVFDRCHSMCRVFRAGNLIQCYPGYCQMPPAGEVQDNTLSFDLESERKKHIILEYWYGYSEKGYIEACRICNGSRNINNNYCIPGEQSKK